MANGGKMNSYQKQTQWIAAGILSLLGPLAFPSLSPGDALDTLHLRNPLPTPDALQSIGFGDNKFIAADNRGDVFASLDGLTWTAIGNVGTELLTEIVFGSGRYVAYSVSSGHFLSSEDGASWTLRASVPPFTFRKLA